MNTSVKGHTSLSLCLSVLSHGSLGSCCMCRAVYTHIFLRPAYLHVHSHSIPHFIPISWPVPPLPNSSVPFQSFSLSLSPSNLLACTFPNSYSTDVQHHESHYHSSICQLHDFTNEHHWHTNCFYVSHSSLSSCIGMSLYLPSSYLQASNPLLSLPSPSCPFCNLHRCRPLSFCYSIRHDRGIFPHSMPTYCAAPSISEYCGTADELSSLLRDRLVSHLTHDACQPSVADINIAYCWCTDPNVT